MDERGPHGRGKLLCGTRSRATGTVAVPFLKSKASSTAASTGGMLRSFCTTAQLMAEKIVNRGAGFEQSNFQQFAAGQNAETLTAPGHAVAGKCEAPDERLEQLNRGQAPVLAGLAPWTRQSGPWQGQRHIGGGRST